MSIKHNIENNSSNFAKKIEILANLKTTPTIISRDLKIQGELVSTGIVEIQGMINGTINGNSVILREEGQIDGIVFAENLSIRGKFNGKIRAKNLNIANKAVVDGEIEYEILSVEDGASIDGRFKKIETISIDHKKIR